MCNDYAREIEADKWIQYMREMEHVPPFEWANDQTPNNIGPKQHIKITESGLTVGLKGGKLIGSMMKWAWKERGRPIFNYISEKRDFSHNDRYLILATGFYEYTASKNPKAKLKEQHLFSLKGEEWFWVAGIVKHNAFTMLTTAPGPDIEPYHDRQICIIPPKLGIDWLLYDHPERLLKAPPTGTLGVKTLQRWGSSGPLS
ncbi:MAG TPA: SOS response-associated peptidase family protein [Terriglobales bacterium]|jgi:putative SOS response-associated peptidase YedK|nr:SOS response-associated peptidase family protein [Terriglobales bacterium]